MTTSTAPNKNIKTALLVVDIQNGFLPPHDKHWGPARSNPRFEENSASIIESYRALIASSSSTSSAIKEEEQRHKIIHIQHSSTSPTSPLHSSNKGSFAFQDFATPKDGEDVIVKHVNSGFIGTDLEERLRSHFGTEKEGKGSGKLYIIGLTTDHCVSTTTRMAGNLKVTGEEGKGGEVVLVGDATACHEKNLEDGEEDGERLDAELVMKVHLQSLREFARVCGTAKVLKELESLRE
jgi:nicotinamidase-related amidase